MKKVLSTLLWYGLYLGLYATLWYTFYNGVNVYMDRFQNAMTGLYILTNCIFGFLVFCMWIINYAIDKGDPKLTKSMTEFVTSDTAKDFVNIKERHNKLQHVLYRYAAFYPAIFCAGILLGYTNMAIAMLIDVALVYMLKAQVETLVKSVKTKKNFSDKIS